MKNIRRFATHYKATFSLYALFAVAIVLFTVYWTLKPARSGSSDLSDAVNNAILKFHFLFALFWIPWMLVLVIVDFIFVVTTSWRSKSLTAAFLLKNFLLVMMLAMLTFPLLTGVLYIITVPILYVLK